MITVETINNYKLTPQYLAGLFDGEGCIGLYKRTDRPSYDLVINIAQKDLVLLAFILVAFPKAYIKKGHRINTFSIQKDRSTKRIFKLYKRLFNCKKIAN